MPLSLFVLPLVVAVPRIPRDVVACHDAGATCSARARGSVRALARCARARQTDAKGGPFPPNPPPGGTDDGGFGDAGTRTISLTLAPFTAKAGGDVYQCEDFTNPVGADFDVQSFESHATGPMESMILFEEPSSSLTDAGSAACSGLTFTATPYVTQQLDGVLTYPVGVASHVSAANGFHVSLHGYNPTGADAVVTMHVVLHLAPAGSVKTYGGVLFGSDTAIDVPPSSSITATDSCSVPVDMNIVAAGELMLSNGSLDSATIAGTSVYRSSSWSHPSPATFSPPLVAHAGDPLVFSCSYTNSSATALTFGPSERTNAQCMFYAAFYPVPSGQVTLAPAGCVSTQM